MKSEKSSNKKIKLHIGCGKNYFDDWINLDGDLYHDIKKLDVNWDLRNPLPFKNNSVDFIFHEHFLEHLTAEEGFRALLDFKRVLKPGGVMRVAMPDLADMVKVYNNPNWREENEESLNKVGLGFIKTKAEYMNINFRWWEHKWLYDWEELERRLNEAGFKNIEPHKLKESNIIDLKDLETRAESILIAEATKANVKIPCFVLTFFDYDVIKKSFDFLTRFNDRLDIHVVENHSDFTESHIKPYLLDLVEQGKISSYYLFDENIGVNAMEIVTRVNASYINDYDYFMITDGDLISENEDWLDELVEIIENNSEVCAVGMELDMSNRPSENIYPESKYGVQKAKKVEGKNYSEVPTGWRLSLYRTQDFLIILELILKAGEKLVDYKMFKYCTLLGKKWARTKKSLAYHLTWDSYSNLEHPYTKWKSKLTHQELWEHERYCNYTLFKKSGSEHYTVDRKH